ncbi:MAG: hypothetical protein E7J78_10140 [Pantoea sp.]|nr:hypothetical protein [Pantoea sp.]
MLQQAGVVSVVFGGIFPEASVGAVAVFLTDAPSTVAADPHFLLLQQSLIFLSRS